MTPHFNPITHHLAAMFSTPNLDRFQPMIDDMKRSEADAAKRESIKTRIANLRAQWQLFPDNDWRAEDIEESIEELKKKLMALMPEDFFTEGDRNEALECDERFEFRKKSNDYF